MFRVSTHECLEFTSLKSREGAYTEKPYECTRKAPLNHRPSKIRGWAFTQRRVLTRDNTVDDNEVRVILVYMRSYTWNCTDLRSWLSTATWI